MNDRYSTSLSLALLPFLLILSGCPKILSLDYQPSNVLRGQGTIQIESFRYAPFEKGEVRAKQVQLNPRAAGSVYLSQDVALFFTDALKRELIHSGYQITPQTERSLSGQIDRFYLDWVDAGDITFDMSVTYVIREGDRVVDTRTVFCRSTKPKDLMNNTVIIQEATKTCISQLLQGAQEAKAL